MRFVTNLFASSVLHFGYGGVDVACEIFFPLILRNNRPMDYTSERKIFNSARFANYTHKKKHIKDAANSNRFISILEWLHPALFSIAGVTPETIFKCVQTFFWQFSTNSPGTATFADTQTPDFARFWRQNEVWLTDVPGSTHFIRTSSIFHRHVGKGI